MYLHKNKVFVTQKYPIPTVGMNHYYNKTTFYSGGSMYNIYMFFAFLTLLLQTLSPEVFFPLYETGNNVSKSKQPRREDDFPFKADLTNPITG